MWRRSVPSCAISMSKALPLRAVYVVVPDGGGNAPHYSENRGTDWDWSRRHDYRAELAEVLIEAKCRGDSELVDHNLAGAVGEAPFLVGVLVEELPGGADVGFTQKMEGCQGPGEDL